MSATIYIEGGGDSNQDLERLFRRSWTTFFKAAELSGHLPRIVRGGGRERTFDLGSLWIAGSYSQNAFNEAFEERFAPFSHVMNELKKAQIEWEFFLRDASVWSQPRA